eukprot:CAMPEP_0119298252 /NCGR_PEP_ID=MMETSP1333-20130426/461_1 /TAXON_ID=418940 /ORGANISM="Scyphosphaera apsteinii, Strain RCC1455" /LENGTH=310 /DNA_ID=CAMNT_0007299309 /DNA_START=94 /DNA_END=1026 /DNA_ORIENTATION=+
MDKIETSHEDLIHDAQLDYYGKRLATCSSDRTIKIFDIVEGGERKQVADLTGHDGPVWEVAWAHPRFGNVLASCSYDRQVFVWKEIAPNVWNTIYKYSGHEQSVNSIAWSPPEHGLCLACASSDGYISVLTHNADNTWTDLKIEAHKTGCNAVSWAPAFAAGSAVAAGQESPLQAKRLVSGGCDNLVKIWHCISTEVGEQWDEVVLPRAHSDWVRDVAWAPSLGAPDTMLASCSQDKKVIIWTQDPESQSTWTQKEIQFPCVVWRVSWSVTGNILAVSGGDNLVTLWKQNLLGDWEQLGQLSDDSNPMKA